MDRSGKVSAYVGTREAQPTPSNGIFVVNNFGDSKLHSDSVESAPDDFFCIFALGPPRELSSPPSRPFPGAVVLM